MLRGWAERVGVGTPQVAGVQQSQLHHTLGGGVPAVPATQAVPPSIGVPVVPMQDHAYGQHQQQHLYQQQLQAQVHTHAQAHPQEQYQQQYDQEQMDLAVPAPAVPAPPAEHLDGLVAAPVPMSTGGAHILEAADVAASHATVAPIFAPSGSTDVAGRGAAISADEDFV